MPPYVLFPTDLYKALQWFEWSISLEQLLVCLCISGSLSIALSLSLSRSLSPSSSFLPSSLLLISSMQVVVPGYPGGRNKISPAVKGYRLLFYQSCNSHNQQLNPPAINIFFESPEWDIKVGPHHYIVYRLILRVLQCTLRPVISRLHSTFVLLKQFADLGWKCSKSIPQLPRTICIAP